MSDKQHTEHSEKDSKQDSLNSRRSFIKKGAVAAPIIAMASSRPVWGADDSCINSGTLSGNLSNHGCQAIGRSPGWWWNQGFDHQWKGCRPNDTFDSIFHCQPFKRTKGLVPYADTDSVCLRDLGPSDGKSVDMHVIAAVLNFEHPGIAYSGRTGKYASGAEVIAAYRNARAQSNYRVMRSLLTNLKNELDSYDPDGHDVHLNDLV